MAKTQSHNGITLPNLSRLAVLSSLVISQGVFAHGYISEPASRSFKCKLGENVNCGAVQFEPQSVEGTDGFPQGGPQDGTLAAGGLSRFSELNEQTATRWSKTTIQPGRNNFTWIFTANHVTADFQYFITKTGWNQNQPLSRDQLDLEPFCVVDGNQQRPPVELTHTCNVPSDRSGHHIIFATWDVGDTPNTFYQAVDVIIDNNGGGGNPDPDPVDNLIDVGDINPSVDLSAGDKVGTRVFNTQGEIPGLRTEITLESDADGERNNWPFLLAQAINDTRTELAAGNLDDRNAVVPARGRNDIFALESSGIVRVEVDITQNEQPVADIDVIDLRDSYDIVDGKAVIDFTLSALGELNVEFSAFDPNNAQAGFGSTTINDTVQAVQLEIANPREGTYSLVVKAVAGQGEVIQKTFSFELVAEDTGGDDGGNTGEFDFTFPEGLSSYKAGTRVFQPKDGNIYECKPFPFEGYCRQWSVGSNQFEPGVGASFQSAWELVK